MVLGVLDPLVGLHTGLAERLRALHAVACGQRIVLAAGAALGWDKRHGVGTLGARFTLIKH